MLREKISSYNYSEQWCPGKDMLAADALSRNPMFATEEEKNYEKMKVDKKLCPLVYRNVKSIYRYGPRDDPLMGHG